MIYGNVKALIPLVREKLTLEFDENQKPRYKRGIMTPLREKLIYGVVTRSQVGYIPTVDICFGEEEETYTFNRDTYVFKSLKSKNLHMSDELQDVFDNSEHAAVSIKSEIKKIREYNDFSREAIVDEEVD